MIIDLRLQKKYLRIFKKFVKFCQLILTQNIGHAQTNTGYPSECKTHPGNHTERICVNFEY